MRFVHMTDKRERNVSDLKRALDVEKDRSTTLQERKAKIGRNPPTAEEGACIAIGVLTECIHSTIHHALEIIHWLCCIPLCSALFRLAAI